MRHFTHLRIGSPMNHTQRSEIVDRLERRHEDLIEQLDSLNQQIEQVLGSLTRDRESLSEPELPPDLPTA
jgi:chaperonin cofactor prefoldin